MQVAQRAILHSSEWEGEYLCNKSQRSARWDANHSKYVRNQSFSNRNYTATRTHKPIIIIMLTNIANFIRQNKYKILGGISLAAAAYFALQFFREEGETKMSSFIQAVNQEKVHEVLFDGSTLYFRSSTSQWFKTFLGNQSSSKIYQIIKDKGIEFSYRNNLIPQQIYSMTLVSVLSVLAFKYVTRSLNKPQISEVDLKSSLYSNNTFFNDYYGGQEIKEKFSQLIDFLKHPQRYYEMGARIRRGILFYGPPGTGKTMLARALANESGCQFIKLVASQLQEMFVGVGAKRVRELFAAARKCQQGCIIFVDQIDALGSRANHLRDSHQTTTTINQFLNQMDGFSPNQRIIVVAATNRLDLVDSAVLRSGRFDLKLHIPLPNAAQRKGILNTLLQKKLGNFYQIEPSVVGFVAQASQGWCGADIETLLNESIYRAIAQDKGVINKDHLLQAFEEMQSLR